MPKDSIRKPKDILIHMHPPLFLLYAAVPNASYEYKKTTNHYKYKDYKHNLQAQSISNACAPFVPNAILDVYFLPAIPEPPDSIHIIPYP